eukprot:1160526-Pelagomonas_calceolata.AAC.12
MAVANGKQAFQNVVDVVKDELNECTEFFRGVLIGKQAEGTARPFVCHFSGVVAMPGRVL